MRILCTCEESQAVTRELRFLGHEAYSNDIIETSGDNPEWHIQENFLNIFGNWFKDAEYIGKELVKSE